MSKIHVLGASGSGTTTTAQALSQKLGYVHLDTDNYFWEPSEIPFTKKREIKERIKLLENDLQKNKNVVLSGIFYPWGDELTKYFDEFIYVETDRNIRKKRLIEREYKMFGKRMLKGGDMNAQFKRFLKWAMNYEENVNDDIGQEKTEQWLSNCKKKIIRVDGSQPVEQIIKKLENELECCREEEER